MKHLLISNVFPPQAGGSGRWFWELYRRLPRDQYAIAAGHCSGDAQFDAEHELDVERLPLDFSSWGVVGLAKLREYAQAARRIRSIMHQRGTTLLHAGCCLPEGFLAWWLSRRTELAYLVYVHGEELEVAHTSRELTWMTRRVLAGAKAVIANSENTRRLLADKWQVSSDVLHVLHPGVDIEKFTPAPSESAVPQELGWTNRQVVLTVGRLQARKGHDMMIQALPEIRRHAPRILYAIVGDGPQRTRLQELAHSLGLNDCVKFLGELQDSRIVPCYQSCDVFALPNREVDGDFEGFGIVLLEAQACGKPVIAGDSGGTAETLDEGRTGHVVDCRTPELLANTILELLHDEQRRQTMGAAARRWVEQRFAWEPLAEQADHLFRTLEVDQGEARACTPRANAS